MKIRDSKLLEAAYELVQALDKEVDSNLPEAIAEIVKFHSKGAAVAGVAGGWVPGVGGVMALAVSGGFVWTMYGRINGKINMPLSENIVKSVATAVATNIAAGAAVGIACSAVFSLIPGIGTIGAMAVVGSTCYAVTLASGFVYLKILTSIFNSGGDPAAATVEAFKKTADKVMANEDIKAVIAEAKKAYTSAVESGDIPEGQRNKKRK